MATRYKIRLRSTEYVSGKGYKIYAYTVCTCLDERKAIVMVTCAFNRDYPTAAIYQVLSVEKLEGDEALGRDISDRLEY
jgi:hypothetical protein